MAGIGFRLQKLLDEGTYAGSLKAYAYSAMIAAGPFLLTVLVVSFIHVVSLGSLTPDEMATLQSLVTHAFAFSLIGVGPSYLVVTRYVADEYYRGHVSGFAAVFFSTVAANAAVWGPFAFWFFWRLPAEPALRLMAFLLAMTAMAVWLALVFLSAAKDYLRIVRVFSAGAAVAMALAWAWGRSAGLAGFFGGFLAGQALTLALLGRALLLEFGYREPRDWYWLGYFKRYPELAGIGFLYNLGIWADKLLFWASPAGSELETGLRHCPVYDAPMFFSYLTILPALSYFLIQMETEFFRKYHAYYRGIERQEGLGLLEKRRVEMVRSLGLHLKRLAVLQGVVSGLALLAVPWVVEATRMDPLQMGILRIGIFASFLQAGFLIVMNLLLYFDFRREALWTAGGFCAANLVLTGLSLRFGLPAYGFGYTAACFFALAAATILLNERLRLLHFWTFMTQPIPKPVVVEE